jgi:hypothetical protein
MQGDTQSIWDKALGISQSSIYTELDMSTGILTYSTVAGKQVDMCKDIEFDIKDVWHISRHIAHSNFLIVTDLSLRYEILLLAYKAGI